MIEAIEVLIYLEALLASVSGSTGVYRGVAPNDAVPPFIIVAYQGGSDAMAVNGYRLMNNSVYQVKAVGKAAQNAAIVSIAYAMDATVQRSAGTTTNGRILMVVREQPLILDQNVDGVIWSTVGGLYRAYATPINQ